MKSNLTREEAYILLRKYNKEAGCSRDIIKTGAERLGWELDVLMEKTMEAMRSCEADIAAFMENYEA